MCWYEETGACYNTLLVFCGQEEPGSAPVTQLLTALVLSFGLTPPDLSADSETSLYLTGCLEWTFSHLTKFCFNTQVVHCFFPLCFPQNDVTFLEDILQCMVSFPDLPFVPV